MELSSRVTAVANKSIGPTTIIGMGNSSLRFSIRTTMLLVVYIVPVIIDPNVTTAGLTLLSLETWTTTLSRISPHLSIHLLRLITPSLDRWKIPVRPTITSDLLSLALYAPLLLRNWSGEIVPVPEPFRSCPHWQYGTGAHASPGRVMLGSAMLADIKPTGTELNIRHLILDASSQWVIGRNFTSPSNILVLKGRFIELSSHTGARLLLSLTNHNMHLHLPLTLFLSLNRATTTLQPPVQQPRPPYHQLLYYTDNVAHKISLPPSTSAAFSSQPCLRSMTMLWESLSVRISRRTVMESPPPCALTRPEACMW